MYVLLALIFIIGFVPAFISDLITANRTLPDVTSLINQTSRVALSADSQLFSQQQERAQTLFPFNPNTADEATLGQLGFSPRAIKTLINYRNKGGKIKKADDLYKFYHVDSALISRLIPYVQLPEYSTKSYASTQSNAPIELNTCDSLALVALFGVGPKMAQRILQYRQAVGGFLKVEQLLDVWGFDTLLLYELRHKITVNPSFAPGLKINQVTYDELKLNPYIRFRLAAQIINYRTQHGLFTSIDDLKKIKTMPDSVLTKISPLLRFD
jgi:DNA uptake protein ComE-like DNA-binding protein